MKMIWRSRLCMKISDSRLSICKSELEIEDVLPAKIRDEIEKKVLRLLKRGVVKLS